MQHKSEMMMSLLSSAENWGNTGLFTAANELAIETSMLGRLIVRCCLVQPSASNTILL